jgi:AcrR family transcriptional regulator
MPIEARRQQALDAALRLITEHGYRAVTMNAIAREADLAKPVLYNAYPGLGPLLRALLGRERARGLGALTDAMPNNHPDADPTAALLAWLRHLANAIARNPGPWRLILIPPDETPEVVREHVQAGRDFALDQARALMHALLDQGSPPTVDRELAAQSLLASAERAAGLMIRDPDEYPPERLVQFAAAFLRALGLS